jgi:hypothetical protein
MLTETQDLLTVVAAAAATAVVELPHKLVAQAMASGAMASTFLVPPMLA